MEKLSQHINQIRALISQNKIREAITEMQQLLKGSLAFDEIILQSSRYNDVKKSIRMGTIKYDDSSIELRRIDHALLEMLSELEESYAVTLTSVTPESITIDNNGNSEIIEKTLKGIMALLDKLETNQLKIADKIYDRNLLTQENFEVILGRLSHDGQLPQDITKFEHDKKHLWTRSLGNQLKKKGIAVKDDPMRIFEHYGWLIETFLRKMCTPAGLRGDLQSLTYKADAFLSSLRQLCYIQIAQLMQLDQLEQHQFLRDFLDLRQNQNEQYDYINLLILTTNVIDEKTSFVPEIHALVKVIQQTDGKLYKTIIFLEKTRNQLIHNKIQANEHLPEIQQQYLSGLVYWLRHLAFLAKYKLISIREISLKYRLGIEQKFIHNFGELHGFYQSASFDYTTLETDLFTYNQSVLLFKGRDVETCMEKMAERATNENKEAADLVLSLSPMVIDRSVFEEERKDTPEIYYYIGKENAAYQYLHFERETNLTKGKQNRRAYKPIEVHDQNLEQPKLDELYTQIERLFHPQNQLL